MGKRKLIMALEETQPRIENCLSSDGLRLDEKAFTRQRSLGAKRILHILLKRIYRALQLQLDKYYEEIGEQAVSKQALSKARKHLNPEYVRGFADMTAEIAAKDDSVPSYAGMRLIAIDGLDVALENTEGNYSLYGSEHALV